VLKKRADGYYELFRKVLKDTDQYDVLQLYFPEQRVCCYEFYDTIVQLQFSVIERVTVYHVDCIILFVLV